MLGLTDKDGFMYQVISRVKIVSNSIIIVSGSDKSVPRIARWNCGPFHPY